LIPPANLSDEPSESPGAASGARNEPHPRRFETVGGFMSPQPTHNTHQSPRAHMHGGFGVFRHPQSRRDDDSPPAPPAQRAFCCSGLISPRERNPHMPRLAHRADPEGHVSEKWTRSCAQCSHLWRRHRTRKWVHFWVRCSKDARHRRHDCQGRHCPAGPRRLVTRRTAIDEDRIPVRVERSRITSGRSFTRGV
jgi:hypothetical protein